MKLSDKIASFFGSKPKAPDSDSKSNGVQSAKKNLASFRGRKKCFSSITPMLKRKPIKQPTENNAPNSYIIIKPPASAPPTKNIPVSDTSAIHANRSVVSSPHLHMEIEDSSSCSNVSKLRDHFEKISQSSSNKSLSKKSTPIDCPPIRRPTLDMIGLREKSMGVDSVRGVNLELPVVQLEEDEQPVDDEEVESMPCDVIMLPLKPQVVQNTNHSSVESLVQIVELARRESIHAVEENEKPNSTVIVKVEEVEEVNQTVNQYFDSAIELEDKEESYNELREHEESEVLMRDPVTVDIQPKSNGISTLQRERFRNILAQQALKEDAEFDDAGAPIFINFKHNNGTLTESYDESENEYPLKLDIQMRDVKDDYTIFESLGNGKFGRVHRCKRADDVGVEEFAAKFVKTRKLQRHDNGQIMEVAVLCAIGRHPQIASIHAVYETSLDCCIVTELVTGGALYDRIYEDAELTEQLTVCFIRQMLLGLKHLEKCSVLHRDLKPENLMLVDKKHHRLKIIDFGFACFFDKSRPPRLLAGTPVYSAPETLNYDNQCFATDLWSVAVIAYEILSGITPFEVPQGGGDAERTLEQNEILNNISLVKYSFDDEGVADASVEAKSFISSVLVRKPENRPTVDMCLQHPWISMPEARLPKVQRTVSMVRRTPGAQSFRVSLAHSLTAQLFSFPMIHLFFFALKFKHNHLRVS
ncbi:hypothetical protein Ciccas_004677 [Cichlidogyrus casuarinus]|uniref:Protein kinase domain-containing protein n=1 Tax=Cichlidogyrus casuarinus TaxID=1844966 RepID=A0ABD2QAS5_9PLAT